MMIIKNPDNEKSSHMSNIQLSRRSLLQSSLSFVGPAVLLNRTGRAGGFMSANDRPRVGAIGTGSRWCQKATGVDGPWGSAPRRIAVMSRGLRSISTGSIQSRITAITLPADPTDRQT